MGEVDMDGIDPVGAACEQTDPQTNRADESAARHSARCSWAGPGRHTTGIPTNFPAPQHVFVYGTLLPGQERWRFLQRWVVGEGVTVTASGELFDTGLGYPAAVFAADPNCRAGVIHGMRFSLRRATLDDALVALDEVEGAVLGLFHRVTIQTADGVDAWAYTLGAELEMTPVPGGDWLQAQQRQQNP